MHILEWLTLLMLAATALTTLARRIGAPYPALLALGGAALAFAPGAPILQIEPSLALALFIAPILVDAAYDASLRDLKDNWLPIGTLAIVAVILTSLAVAFVVVALAPGIPFAAALALGAAVAPPDAAAATAVLRHMRPPHRIRVILEGESLFNDASALLIYQLAVAATLAGAFDVAQIAPNAALTAFGGVAYGWVLAIPFSRILRLIADAPTLVVLQFAAAFAVWMSAEHLHLSAVLAVVAFGLAQNQRAPRTVSAALRVPTHAAWESAVFLLNILAFTLIGLQLRPIVTRLTADEQASFALVAGAVALTVIVVRLVWSLTYIAAVRAKNQRFGVRTPRPMAAPSFAGGIAVGWGGMRGIVTLAAVYALPIAFPQRDLIVVCAFAVVLVTLVLQGLTLGPLIRALRLRDDGQIEREVLAARAETEQAVLEALRRTPTSEEGRRLMRETKRALLELDPRRETPQAIAEERALRQRMVAVRRRVLADMLADGRIGDDAYREIEDELDRAELALESGPSQRSVIEPG